MQLCIGIQKQHHYIYILGCQKCLFSGARKWDFERPNPKTETTFSRQHPPKMVDLTLVSCVYHFWMRNKQILNFAYFYLIFPWARAIFFKMVAKPGKCKKNHFFCRNGLYTCWYRIYQEAMRFWRLFGILVHPTLYTLYSRKVSTHPPCTFYM